MTTSTDTFTAGQLRPETFQHRFRALYGKDAACAFFAPGRVNLIGEHTDYNDGFVLPIALDRGTLVLASPQAESREVRVFSVNENNAVTFNLDADTAQSQGHWSNYVEGMARSLELNGHRLSGADLLIASNVPVGAGLSSSAAL